MFIRGYANRVRHIWTHPGNRQNRLAALKRALRWRAHLCFSNEPYTTEIFGRLKFRVPDADVSRSVMYFGEWFEYDEMKFVAEYLRCGDSVLDVGANAGIYTLLAASIVGPAGHVDAVEPVPATGRRLLENVRINEFEDVVQLHDVAVGETNGFAQMTSASDATNHVMCSADDAGGVSVPCVRLDTLMSSRTYAFAKLDVEGMELPALKGAINQIMAGNPPVWMIEVNGSQFRYGITVEELFAWVQAHGYDVAKYHHSTRTFVVTDKPWDNVFLVNRSAWDSVRARVAGLVRK